ncbi:MAG: hydroxymethylglutaryl-CoA synthase [Chloroflexi bacterium]|nr:hydroxymethylglutaryl-CoA synthase [Chloroflexota bacterium]MBI3040730.1 hydroxymethylglutaryl-CoA synthase [Chloroflexota bacterium]MBI3930765.1 hydroxymethylglutaryl-CoA synthase [Chloroflexota bacterium]
MAGIVSYGAYIPYYRLPRSVINKAWGRGGGRGEKAVAGFDEDSITMSIAAGLDCLKRTDPKTVDALFLATTTAPYKERQNSTIAATALDLRRDARNADFANCLRAGTTALLSALDAVNAGSLKSVLVTAADTRLGGASGENEQAFGDGSAAFLLGNKGVAVEIEGSYTLSDDLADYWRAHEDTFVRAWEDRFGRDEGYMKIPAEAAAGVMKKYNLAPKDFAKVCFYGANSRAHAALGGEMKFKPEQIQEPLLDTVGNTGAALPLMILVAALENAKAGDRILLVSWGNGSDAIVLRVTEQIEKIRDRRGIKRHLDIKRTLDNYGRYLRWREMVPLDPPTRHEGGLASMAAQWREHATALPLYGVKCKQCGTPQLFQSASSTHARICLECFAKDNFEPYRFADKRAKLVSFSHDYLGGGIDPPTTAAIIDFDGGGRGAFNMVDRDPDECQVGIGVEMTFRKLRYLLGSHTYVWKCKPVRD